MLFRSNRAKETESGIFVGSLDDSRVQLVLQEFSNAAYVPAAGRRASGFLLFERAGSLMSQPFDPSTLRMDGEAFTVAEQIAGETGRTDFTVSNGGVLAYRSATLFQLTWVSRSGAKLSEVGSPGAEWAPGGALRTFRLSPDETKVAYAREHGEGGRSNGEVWQLDLPRNVPERLTFAPGPDLVPVWSPDGRQLAFASNRDDATGFDPYVVSPGSEERLLAKIPGDGWPLDWSPDGHVVLLLQGGIVWIVPTGSQNPIRYLERDVRVARFAPNGHWVAYVSSESGQSDVYVRPFPGPGPAMRVSGAGGTEPQWRRDGHELFYVARDGALTAVPVMDDGTTIQFGRSVKLFSSAVGYQASADGQRFLVARRAESTEPPITVVLNWQSAIDR